MLSLYPHSGHRLTGCRVRASDRAAAITCCENGDAANERFKLPQAGALAFLHVDVTLCENLSDA